MKIVQVANHYAPCIGGIERVVQDISIGLAGKGHEVRVVCLDRCANSKEKLPEMENIGGIGVERVPFLDLKYYKVAPSVFSRIGDAEVVHVHGIGFLSDFLIITKPLHKKKVVVSTHGGIFHTKAIGMLKSVYFRVVQGIVLNFADAVIAVSKNDYELFSKICGKTALIENGIDLSGISAAQKRRNTFLFVGRFSRNKRVENMLEAFSRLQNRKFELLIAGVDWENLLESYKEKVKALGIEKNVRFVIGPSKDELRALYAGSEFFVSASRYEGFGLALVEGMAHGCIPIVQGNEGFSAILRKGEGFFVDFDESGPAAEKIGQILGKNRESIGKAAAKRAKDFDMGKNASSLEKAYGAIK
ncbi:MAG TPA: glycosyltransferase family 4 protein [archaeon]|nr:glycosyltransferase family 4 protein [archaeon]